MKNLLSTVVLVLLTLILKAQYTPFVKLISGEVKNFDKVKVTVIPPIKTISASNSQENESFSFKEVSSVLVGNVNDTDGIKLKIFGKIKKKQFVEGNKVFTVIARSGSDYILSYKQPSSMTSGVGAITTSAMLNITHYYMQGTSVTKLTAISMNDDLFNNIYDSFSGYPIIKEILDDQKSKSNERIIMGNFTMTKIRRAYYQNYYSSTDQF